MEMFSVLRGLVWKEKPGQSTSIPLQNYPFRTEMFAVLASAECAGFGGIVLTGLFTRHRRR